MPLYIRERPSAVVLLLSVRRCRILQVSVLLCCLAMTAGAQPADEYQVKGAFLFNFAKFVEWPASTFPRADTPLQICVLGEDPFGPEFEQSISEKIVQGHRVEVAHPDGASHARTCQILFIAGSERRRIPEILRQLKGTSTLTVGDTPAFAQMGGIINFVLDQNRVRFEINLEAAELAHLKLSARLLNVAKLVLPGEPTGAN